MLVLSRKRGEYVQIGDSVRVYITRIYGNRVAVGVEAPEHVTVLRGELGSGSLPSPGGISTEQAIADGSPF